MLAGQAGCASLEPAAPEAGAIELTQTPFYPQQQYQCGPAALATLLTAAGVPSTPEQLVAEVYLPARHGSLQAELIAAARRHGRLPYLIDPTAGALRTQLAAGNAVLVLQNFGSHGHPLWHYAVVVGYEGLGGAYLLRSGTTRREREPARRFLATWERAGNWGLVLALPGSVPAAADPLRYLQAAAGFEDTGQLPAALSAYAAATRRWPEQPAAWFALAGAQIGSGQLAAAEASYRELVQIAPSDAPAHNNLALLLLRRGCVEAARAELALAQASADGRFAADVADTAEEISAHAGTSVPAASCTAP